MLKREMYNRRVEEVMSKVQWSVEPLDPLSEALGKMKKYKVRELPVIEKGKLKGLLTFRTLARRRKMPISSHVKSFMISPPKVKPTDKIFQVAERLITRDFSSLPVTHKTDVMGMISRTDIISMLKEDDSIRTTSVESVMNFAPTTISKGIGLKKALTLLDLSGEPTAAVVDDEGRFMGSVTTKDIVGFLESPPNRPHKGDFHGEKLHRDRTIDSLATIPPTLVRSDPIRKVIDLMIDNDLPTIYILDGDELVGSINDVDILEIFLKGPSRGGPLIQIAGVEDVKLMDASELNSLISKFVSKLERLVPVSSATVRIRHHHHDSDEDKYTVNVKLVTKTEVIVREAYDWDLLVAIGNAFVTIEQQVKKDKNIRNNKRRRQKV